MITFKCFFIILDYFYIFVHTIFINMSDFNTMS
nr:MAG TPA: hypothetical protein [Caudoviricetes sp.]